jgi:hypothetical protein
MTDIRIVVNDTVEFDGEPGEFKQKPPDLFRDMIDPKPGGTFKPWLNHIAMAMADSIKMDQSVDIVVQHRSNRWEMKVEQR